MLDAFLAGAHQVFAFDTLTYMLIGSVAGIIAAAIPGFTVTMAIILTLPLTFAMEPLQGVSVMLSVYVGLYRWSDQCRPSGDSRNTEFGRDHL